VSQPLTGKLTTNQFAFSRVTDWKTCGPDNSRIIVVSSPTANFKNYLEWLCSPNFLSDIWQIY